MAPAKRNATNPPAAGYSGTPLWKKLGLKSGQSVSFVHAPRGFDALLRGGPDDLRVVTRGAGELDLVVLFAARRSDVEADLAKYARRLAPAGMLWVGWPKKQSGVATDLTEDSVRRFGLDAGLVDVKVCAIDATWSGLKLVRRLVDRPKSAGAKR